MNSLSPLGWLYGLAIEARNTLYDRGVLSSYPLGTRTISVGNLTTGGTGKTPLVALISRILSENGEKVCILTRGYGREHGSDRILVSDGSSVLCDARKGGDEPVELAYKLIGQAAVLADGDRVAGAEWARAKLHPTVFVLDDAFQHRRARRDLDIVCIDATNPFGNGEILPAGTLRERLTNLERANAIVITRTDLVKNVEDIEREVKKLAPKATVFRSANRISRIVEIQQLISEATNGGSNNDRSNVKAFAFCGLGNPSNFFRQLENEAIDLAGRKTFSDHYFYTQDDILDIEKKARAVGADALITTVKDAVRLMDLKISLPCFVAEIETVMADPVSFREMIVS
jgi:tetraacyldisaccharide 4'-kinase